jgi:hypothetical protein
MNNSEAGWQGSGASWEPGVVCAPKCSLSGTACPVDVRAGGDPIGTIANYSANCVLWGNLTEPLCYVLTEDEGPHECPAGMIYGTHDEPTWPNTGPCLWG